MISGFLTSRYQFPPYANISKNLTLIIDFIFSGFFSSEAFDKQTNQVSTDVADKHRSLSAARLLLGRRGSKVTDELKAIMAHIVASITVFVNAPPLYLPRRYAIANAKDCPDALFLCRENGGQQFFFLASSCLTPNKGDLLYLIRNKVDY